MGFSYCIYGNEGDEKVAQSTAIGGLPLGVKMELPDGRIFRHAKMAAASVAAGKVVSCTAGLAGHGNVASSGLLASATTTQNLAGQTAIYVAASLVAFTKDELAGGYANIAGPAASAYIGHVYKIKGNSAAASVGGILKIDLEPTDPLKVSLAPGSTQVSVRKSPYKDLIVNGGASVIAPAMGVLPVAASASFYCWVQRRGVASVRQAATVLLDGAPVIASSTEAGSVTVALSAAAALTISLNKHIGNALEAQAASACVMVYLTLE